jgi:ParB-like chromosome segregation protein Spo0J
MNLNGFPIERKALTDLIPAPWNPRRISEEQKSALAQSVQSFGLVEPIIWNQRSKRVVGGHQRIEALFHNGQTETDVVVVDLDDANEKALNLALNKISGEWDDQKLADLLREIRASIRLIAKELKGKK